MRDKDDLDYDDDDLEELDDDPGDEDFDDDFDDLEELEEEEDAAIKPGIDAASFPEEDDLEPLEEEDEIDDAFEPQPKPASASTRVDGEEDGEDDEAFLNAAVDDDDDLSLGGDGPAAAETVSPPRAGRKTTSIAEDVILPVEKKGLQPVYFILPILGILIGAGVFLLKPGKKGHLLSGLQSRIQKKAPAPRAPFVKPKLDNTIPDDYVKLQTLEIRDPAKITSLIGRGLLKKNEQGVNLKVKSLTLVLYQTAVRYVVSQTYHYTDGTQWKVETQFSELVNDPGEVSKAFAKVYSG